MGLFHDNIKKIQTEATGINVTGRTTWSGGTSAETQSVYLSAGGNNPTQIGLYNGHGGKQGFCFYNNGSGSYKSWGMITDQQHLYFKSAPYNIGNASDLTTNWTDRMTLSNAGRLGLGISTPYNKLTIKGNGDDVIDLIYSGTSGGHESKIQFRDFRDFVNAQINNSLQNDGSGSGEAHLDFKTSTGGNLSTRVRITSSGKVDMATRNFEMATFSATGGSVGLDSNPWGNNEIGIRMSHRVTGGQSLFAFYNPNGQVGYIQTSGSATIYSTSSDYRLKENEVVISDGITRLKQLKPYRFNFKKDPSTTVDGFFAHEVESVVPQAVSGTKDQVATKDEGVRKTGDPMYQGLDYAKLTPLLTAALQEAIAKIEVLEAEVAALKSS